MCADCKTGSRYAAPVERPPVHASPVVTAEFEGVCGGRYGGNGCGDRIDPGDEIRMQHGTAVHDGCETR